MKCSPDFRIQNFARSKCPPRFPLLRMRCDALWWRSRIPDLNTLSRVHWSTHHDIGKEYSRSLNVHSFKFISYKISQSVVIIILLPLRSMGERCNVTRCYESETWDLLCKMQSIHPQFALSHFVVLFVYSQGKLIVPRAFHMV